MNEELSEEDICSVTLRMELLSLEHRISLPALRRTIDVEPIGVTCMKGGLALNSLQHIARCFNIS